MVCVLIVEDDFLNRKLFQTILSRKGHFEVMCSEDPENIVKLVAGRRVDAVVMDVALANSTYQGKSVDGIAITKMLKENWETSWVPVILATAHAMKGDSERFCRISGADDYVSKPILDTDDFVNRIKALVSGHAAS